MVGRDGSRVGLSEFDDGVEGESAGPTLDDVAIGVDEDGGRLAADSVEVPGCETAIFPEHRKRRRTGRLDELEGEVEVVLGAETDDVEDVGVLLSELLNGRALGPAAGSMRGPEPDQGGQAAAGHLLGEVDRFAAAEVDDVDLRVVGECGRGVGCRFFALVR